MKKIYMIFISFIFVLMLSACTTSLSYTFTVENGDNIKVKLDTSGGYKLSQEGSEFCVSKDGVELTRGFFMTEEKYTSYFDNVEGAKGVSHFDSGTYNGNEYIYYQYEEDGTDTWYHVIIVEDSSTGVALSNTNGSDSAEEIFELLSFTKE